MSPFQEKLLAILAISHSVIALFCVWIAVNLMACGSELNKATRSLPELNFDMREALPVPESRAYVVPGQR
jgi:hypothetical protein